jgi:beta-mannosidase
MPLVPRHLREGVIPAQVPGCVHTDLMRAGVIPDPRIGFNEEDQLWVGETDWEYRGTFRVDAAILAHERIDLVCDSLDTIAEVSVNGREVGRAANMFHPHRFDLRGVLNKPGADNDIVIIFRSPLAHVRAEEKRLGRRPFNGDGLGWSPFHFIRKMACNFGWDWAPRMATCGVCGPIRLEGWSTARIESLQPVARPVDAHWIIELRVNVDWASDRTDGALLQASINIDSEVKRAFVPLCPGSRAADIQLGPLFPKPWWPRELGEQPHYTLEVAIARDWFANHHERSEAIIRFGREPSQGTQLWPTSPRVELSGHQECLHQVRRSIGFRQVRLNIDPDEHGEKFQLEINGKPIFCKGANWIPEGLFPEDRSPDKIRQRVRQAADANMNMLRVWGGGQYECDAFYEECDKLGIMVWQDFMFACACYPEEAPFPALIEAEARHQIARLSSHPSVVLWCGGNECVWGYESWGYASTDTEGPWKKRVGDKTWGAGYWFDLLPRLLRELDPTRPYWANSPFAGKRAENPNQETRGDRHTWDAPPGSAEFRKITPRFCAEFGQQSPPSLDLLRKVIAPEDLVLGSHAMDHRQRGTGGMPAHIDKHLQGLPAAKSFEDWHRMSQEAQATALKAAIEWLAANQPRCMGALIWQLNDAWPGFSWSLIDSDGVPKPAYDAVREAFGKIGP